MSVYQLDMNFGVITINSATDNFASIRGVTIPGNDLNEAMLIPMSVSVIEKIVVELIAEGNSVMDCYGNEVTAYNVRDRVQVIFNRIYMQAA